MKTVLMVLSLSIPFVATVVQAKPIDNLEAYGSYTSAAQLSTSASAPSDEVTSSFSGEFEGQPWTIVTCESCYTDDDFKRAASHVTIGNVSVFNLSSGEIRTFATRSDDTASDADLEPMDTPPEALSAMQEYFTLKSALKGLEAP